MKTKTEIILETFEYYETDPSRRAWRIGPAGTAQCLYLSPEGNRCALGRVLSEEKMENHDVSYQFIEGAAAKSVDGKLNRKRNISLDGIIQDDYVGHSIDFWQDLQRYHDTHQFWEGAEGNKDMYKKQLLEKYKD